MCFDANEMKQKYGKTQECDFAFVGKVPLMPLNRSLQPETGSERIMLAGRGMQ